MLKYEISKSFEFSASHHLTDYHGKCEHPHGHNFGLEVTVSGPVKKDGMVIDFCELKKIVQERVIDKLDHKDLNDIFENPSSEIVAGWIWEQLQDLPHDVKLKTVSLQETKTSEVTLRG